MSKKRIGVVGLVLDRSTHELLSVHRLLASHEVLIIGRMEVPLSTLGFTAVALIIHATSDEVGALTGKLGQLAHVRVKTGFL